MATLGERLKELRNSKDITLDKLAEDLGTTKATLSRYENGLRDPKSEFIEKTADYFNVTVDYLLGKTAIKTKKENLVSGTGVISKTLNEIIKSGKEEEFLKVYEVYKKLQYHELEGDAADIVLENAADSYKKIMKKLKK